MKTINKLTTVDTSNLKPGEIIHMDFEFYNVNSICGFTSMLTVIFEMTRMIWVNPTASKRAPVHTTHFITTTPKNEQHPCKRIRFDEDGALANSIYVTTLLIEELKISMETTE